MKGVGAVYQHRLAYRFAVGEGIRVMGFVGSGFTKESARKDSIRKVGIKLYQLSLHYGNQFLEDSRLIESNKGLTAEEKKQVLDDWRVSEGSSIV